MILIVIIILRQWKAIKLKIVGKLFSKFGHFDVERKNWVEYNTSLLRKKTFSSVALSAKGGFRGGAGRAQAPI